jgi:hypothetical protein
MTSNKMREMIDKHVKTIFGRDPNYNCDVVSKSIMAFIVMNPKEISKFINKELLPQKKRKYERD